MARRPPGLKSNGANTIRWPGAYAFALGRKCERDALMAAPDYLTLDDDDVPAWERDNAERAAALYAERDGKPVRALSSDLPKGMPPPFGPRWPHNRGTFTITADDVVTFKPRCIVEIIRQQGAT